jgi:hypothetical protein
MLDDVSLQTAMAEVGYQRLRRHVYRANWSSREVEHFIFFELYGRPKEYLTADFGFRNKEAQAFALRSIRAYGGEIYQMMRQDESSHCPMRFSLGQLAMWRTRSSLKISAMSGVELAEKIKIDIQELLFPVVRGVTTLDRLLSLLVVDEEPCPWVRCNGAIRAAMIVNLARQAGMESVDIHQLLKAYYNEISRHLSGPDRNPNSYIEKIIEDSALSAGVTFN